MLKLNATNYPVGRKCMYSLVLVFLFGVQWKRGFSIFEGSRFDLPNRIRQEVMGHFPGYPINQLRHLLSGLAYACSAKAQELARFVNSTSSVHCSNQVGMIRFVLAARSLPVKRIGPKKRF